MQGAQIELAVESITERGQVSGSIFSEVECMVAAAQAGLEVAEQGVDPLELRQVLGLSPADDGRLMHAACRAQRSEAGEPIGEHGAARGQMRLGPLADRFQVETADGREFGAQRVALIAERECGNERDLVLRAAADFAAATLTAEVGVVELDLAVEDVACLAFGHRLHQLVVHEPGGRIAHPKVTLERQCRQLGLGLADEVDREEPHGQRQLGALHHSTGDQRSLVTTVLALEQRVGSPADPTVGDASTARAPEPRRPARLFQRGCTLRFGPVALEKFGHRQSGLKLDPVHGHGTPPSKNYIHVQYSPVASVRDLG